MARVESARNDVPILGPDGDGTGPTLRVLIVDDHLLFAEAIRTTLEATGATVVGVVQRGCQVLEAVRREHPDIVLLDLGLPDKSGLAVGEEILDEFPTMPVLALTAIDDQKVVSEALRIGFRGYLTKDTPVSKFVRAARTAMDGQVVYQQTLGAGPRRRDEPGALEGQQLTPREREVLALLVEGLSGVVIANRLGISRNTVRTHVQSILTKLQVHSRLEAATFAVRHRLVHTNIPQAVEAVG